MTTVCRLGLSARFVDVQKADVSEHGRLLQSAGAWPLEKLFFA